MVHPVRRLRPLPPSPPQPRAARPAAPPPPAKRAFISPDHPSYKWWVAATMMLSAFLVVMSNTTINVTLPSIMTTFSLNLDQAQWILTAYMIAGAVLIPTVGWLGNWLGNRNLFLFSLIIFIGGSMLCGLAWSGTTLILFRVIQGIGGGPIMPMALVLLNSAFPAHQRGLAMGFYGLAISFGPAIGPVLGGVVTEYLNWRMVFYLNIIPGIATIALGLLVLPKTRDAVRRSLDIAGLVTLALLIVSLLVALSQGQRVGWDTAYIQRLFLIAGVSGVLFVVLSLTRPEPLVDLRLYKDPAFVAISLAALMIAMAFWGTGFLQTILLQRLLNYTPAQAGFVQLPGALCMGLSTLLAGQLVDKFDRRYVIWFGLGLFALASYRFSFLTLDHSRNWVIWMILARYITIGFVFTPMNAASMVLLPPEKVRMGSGIITLMQQGLGGTLGLALMTTVLQYRSTYYASMLAQGQVSSALGWQEVLTPAWDLMQRAGEVGAMVQVKAMALLGRHLMQQATVAAYQDCFLLLAVICLAVMPLVFFLRRHRTA